MGRDPVPDQEVILKALVTGLCALVLLSLPSALSATTADDTQPRLRLLEPATPADLDRRLAGQLRAVRRHRGTIRFFSSHRWLLFHPRFDDTARLELAGARQRLESAKLRVGELSSLVERRRRAIQARSQVRQRAQAKRERRLAATRPETPQEVICDVFGRHCRDALAVARCESGYRTDAQNGQYLGLFQMGDWARSNYGHGATALAQARAAFRLFVDTGRTWQQWSCKP